MNKQIIGGLVAFLLLVSSNCCLAQKNNLGDEIENKRISLGLKGGLNVSNFSKGDYDWRPCVNVGMMLDIPVSLNWSVAPGIMLNMKGARNSIERYWYSVTMNTGANYDYYADEKYFFSPLYLDIPILATYKYHFDEYSYLYASAGPYLSYAIGGKLTKEFTGEDETISLYKNETVNNYPYDMGFKRFQYGLNLEVGLNYEGFIVSLGYDWGLSSVTESSQAISYKQGNRIDKIQLCYPDMQHRIWKLSIGYFFKL